MPTSVPAGIRHDLDRRERIPEPLLEYFRTRNRMNLFAAVLTEFRNSGLTQAELAARLGRGPDRISRLLGAPGNWTLDTVSDLLLAISGATPDWTMDHPALAPPRNQDGPDWLAAAASEMPPASG